MHKKALLLMQSLPLSDCVQPERISFTNPQGDQAGYRGQPNLWHFSPRYGDRLVSEIGYRWNRLEPDLEAPTNSWGVRHQIKIGGLGGCTYPR